MVYVLMLFMQVDSSVAVQSVEFQSKTACQVAAVRAQQVRNNVNGRVAVTAFCVEDQIAKDY